MSCGPRKCQVAQFSVWMKPARPAVTLQHAPWALVRGCFESLAILKEGPDREN